eukprot:COSAG01_NODE_71111_length_257_cov_0.468354_1_plen_59_part_01
MCPQVAPRLKKLLPPPGTGGGPGKGPLHFADEGPALKGAGGGGGVMGNLCCKGKRDLEA